MSIDADQAPTSTMADAFANTVFGVTEAAEAAPSAPVKHGYERYVPGRELGAGGMGRVIAAHDSHFGREVALKLMTGERTPTREARFITEATVTANLEHPGIPHVFERGVAAEGAPYYTMALVQGETLTARIVAAKTLQERLKLFPIVVQIAHALGFAHERGVIHRDIKPDNIIVGQHGEAALIDWGIAKVARLGDAPGTWVEEQGALVGTVTHMSPEQAGGETEKIDERSDVFQLGALLYHVLTGHAPYHGQTLGAAITMALEASFPDIAEAAPGTPPPLRQVIARAMARRREDRYASAIQMADALEDALSRSWSQRESLWVRAVAIGAALAGMAAMLGVVGTVAKIVPSFAALGFSIYLVMLWPLLGVVLTVIELRTAGRYCLSRLILAFAAASFATGIAGATTNLLEVLRFASSEAVLANVDKWRFVVTVGPWEALGPMPLSAVSAAVQLVLWALVERHGELKRRRTH